MKFAFVLPAAVMTSFGCSEPLANPDQVVKVQICPAGGCPMFADGRRAIPVRITTALPNDQIASGLELTVRASAGRWAIPSDATTPARYSRTLVASPVDLDLVPDATADLLIMDATLAGVTSRAAAYLAPAPVGTPQVVATPAALSTDAATTVQLAITVPGVAGAKISAGTTVTLTAMTRPEGHVQVYPASLVVDDDGKTTAQLFVAVAASSVTVHVVATPPRSLNPASPPGQPADSDVVIAR